jgi:asparagine N-glycosylation enzyme membrane subunit Stt3
MRTLAEFVKTPLAMPPDFQDRLGLSSRWKAGLVFLVGQWIGLFIPAAFLLPALAHKLNLLLVLVIVLPLMALGVQVRGLFYFWVARRGAAGA